MNWLNWLNQFDPRLWEYGRLLGSWSWLVMIPLAFLVWGNVAQFKKNALVFVPAIGIVSIGVSYFFRTGWLDHETFTVALLAMIVIAGLYHLGQCRWVFFSAAPVVVMWLAWHMTSRLQLATAAGPVWCGALTALALAAGIWLWLWPDEPWSMKIRFTRMERTRRLSLCDFMLLASPANRPQEEIGHSSQDQPKKLVVFVHGLHAFPDTLRWNMYRKYAKLLKHLQKIQNPCHVAVFRFYGHYISGRSPDALAQLLCKDLETIAGDYEEIYLTGHSFGVLLLRKAILLNIDAKAVVAARDEEKTRVNGYDVTKAGMLNWLGKVKRVVLLAGTNRGFRVPDGMRWLESLARLLTLFFYSRLGSLALDCIRGASWVTQLRMDWIKIFSKPVRPNLEIVQVRGRNDKLVDAEDGIEIFQFSQAPEIAIDYAGHGHFSLIVKKDPRKHGPVMVKVKAAITEAFGEFKEIQKEYPDKPQLAYPKPPEIVVFLIHGIRDFADWHDVLGYRIRKVAQDAKLAGVEPVSITYGYFSAFQFLLPVARRSCLRALVDRYVQYKAWNPDTVFHAIGHSNGTYVIGRSLVEYGFVEFQNIYCAGSVLPVSFPWGEFMDKNSPRVTGSVRNDCANRDLPVGVLCWLLRYLGWWITFWWPFKVFNRLLGELVGGPAPKGRPRSDWLYADLGSAGVDGFEAQGVSSQRLQNNRWFDGGHGCALEFNHHENIVNFILHESTTPNPFLKARAEDLRSRSGRGWRRLQRILVFTVIASCFAWVVYALLASPATAIPVVLAVCATFLLISILLVL
jgi:hypothetical protein